MAPFAFWGAGASIVVAGVAALGDRRRTQRVDPDRVGLVDWRSIQVAALVATILLVSIGLNAR